jgi:hypothetical protein
MLTPQVQWIVNTGLVWAANLQPTTGRLWHLGQGRGAGKVMFLGLERLPGIELVGEVTHHLELVAV